MISMPLADPWSIADAHTELPTREFYMIADLLFDALDKRFEPKNTGLLEATKVLESWRAQDMAEEAARKLASCEHDDITVDTQQSSLHTIRIVPLQDFGLSKAFPTSRSLIKPL